MMKKIKATPSHMRDYKNNLETSMFKKKLGLERINTFQMILRQANIDINSTKSESNKDKLNFKPTKNSIERNNLSTETDMYDTENTMLKQNNSESPKMPNNSFKTASKSLNQHRIARYNRDVKSKSTMQKSLNASMNLKRYHNKLIPIDTTNHNKLSYKSSHNSPLAEHMNKISSILGKDFNKSSQMNNHNDININGNSQNIFGKNRKSALGYTEL